jgi:hypothetical protein
MEQQVGPKPFPSQSHPPPPPSLTSPPPVEIPGPSSHSPQSSQSPSLLSNRLRQQRRRVRRRHQKDRPREFRSGGVPPKSLTSSLLRQSSALFWRRLTSFGLMKVLRARGGGPDATQRSCRMCILCMFLPNTRIVINSHPSTGTELKGIAQGKIGSGFDVAAATFGTLSAPTASLRTHF